MKKYGGSWQKRTSKREKYRLLYGREIQFEQSKDLLIKVKSQNKKIR